MSSRIREIRAVVEPHPDQHVLFFYKNPDRVWCGIRCNAMNAAAWCEPPKLDGTPSGPVHSLEPAELPELHDEVEIRIRGRWFPGVRRQQGWLAFDPRAAVDAHYPVQPDAWRPLPDDEPGDAELWKAVTALTEAWRGGIGIDALARISAAMRSLTDLVKRRSAL